MLNAAAVGAESNSAGALASLGIDDIEQLVAISSIPNVRDELKSQLSLDEKAFDAFVKRYLKALPAERAALVSSPAPAEFGLGVLPMTPEMLATAEASAGAMTLEEAIELPASINLIPYMTPIRNQASRGTCVAFTLTALHEYILRRRGTPQDLSEQHLYYEVKLIDGYPSACGTWQSKAVTVLTSRGQCREIVWPYNPNPPCNNHGAVPVRARTDGLRYRLTTIAVPTRNVQAYKAHMARQRAVTLSIPVYNSWYQSAETRRSGRITMRIGSEPAVGGHAVCLVGYQDNPASPGGGWFIVRNSWSTNWASQSPYGAGYGTIPYQYIANDATEAFTAAVPGMMGDEAVSEAETEGKPSTVTIEVGRNVKITITGDKVDT
ncbi:hypothetical protein VQ02_05660 [Methylobacterium variabile]|jgi:hypothetical protein|uniref:Peptidase C1A papain C-terminal domain-containing protein n=1 Tax=Methylobacterium variabile TaxID=298794 RepID=A0A0J6T655_9HYPH|nr:C1 family peptidase [Methylobacterium variabile]KMO41454.1 hypothetical protein VQ02_05660 [Methylobacterium variabile]